MPKNHNNVVISKVDMTDANNKHLHEVIVNNNGEPLIEGYPTILLEKTKGNFVEYSGPRKKENMLNFIDSN